MGCDQNEWFYVSLFDWTVKSIDDNFPYFVCFWLIFVWFLEWKGFHNLELKWNVILWNAKHCLRAWIFCECELTDPSLILDCIVKC